MNYSKNNTELYLVRGTYASIIFFFFSPTITAFFIQRGHFSDFQMVCSFGIIIALSLILSGFFITSAILLAPIHILAMIYSSRSAEILLNLGQVSGP